MMDNEWMTDNECMTDAQSTEYQRRHAAFPTRLVRRLTGSRANSSSGLRQCAWCR